jgi:protein-S-isoprenylcysteine O-methyltransferase Ste14
LTRADGDRQEPHHVVHLLALVGFFAGYVAALALSAAYPVVFRLVAVTVFAGYALAIWQMSIWYGRARSTTIKTPSKRSSTRC